MAGVYEAVQEYANEMRARGPRPYLDKYKQASNSHQCLVEVNCQGRGGIHPPAAIRSLKTTCFEFPDRFLNSRRQTAKKLSIPQDVRYRTPGVLKRTFFLIELSKLKRGA